MACLPVTVRQGAFSTTCQRQRAWHRSSSLSLRLLHQHLEDRLISMYLCVLICFVFREGAHFMLTWHPSPSRDASCHLHCGAETCASGQERTFRGQLILFLVSSPEHLTGYLSQQVRATFSTLLAVCRQSVQVDLSRPHVQDELPCADLCKTIILLMRDKSNQFYSPHGVNLSKEQTGCC